MRVEFFKHNISNEDIRSAVRVLRSVFLTTGDVVSDFERQFSGYLGVKQTIGLNSCTAALHLSLLAYGVGPGDEVITTPLSFCATSNAILHAGAKPVFVDVEEDTGNINAEMIEASITKKTKALLPVHLYGQMCDMKKIRKLADKHGLVLIEDAAHSIEAERDNIRPGHVSDAACFSFYATKNITSGEGGAVSTNNVKKAELLKMLRLHGIDKSAIDRYTGRYKHWDMPVLGWKYNMDNIHASLLSGQLSRIDKLWAKRDALWKLYEEHLSGSKGLKALKTVPRSRHARHLFTVLVAAKKRDSVMWQLQERGIGVAVNYRPIHLLKFYKKTYGYKKGDFPVAESIGGSTISLPLYPLLNRSALIRVSHALNEIIKRGE
ncbi:MAG: DegT/DnrJ/EryC1/StrS family aminotransferase [Nitrospirae bacterium]|nr:DegT/DnrJ/EryC1/StrS family aminotransferase [Nitrospirota bacterium]